MGDKVHESFILFFIAFLNNFLFLRNIGTKRIKFKFKTLKL